jgi:hypothetical protein
MAESGWQETVERIRAALKGAPVAGGVCVIDDALRPQLAGMLAEPLKENNRIVFTAGQLDPAQAGGLARAGLIKWWHTFAGVSYFGNAENLRSLRALHDADNGQSERHDSFDSTLTWASHPHSVTKGSVTRMDPDTVAQLIEWGANVNHENGKYFGFVLRGSPAEIIALYLDNGAPKQAAEVALQEMTANKNYLQAQRIDNALGGEGMYAKVDAQTLMVTQFIGEPEGVATLKTIYNFRSRRLNEIYTPPGQGAQPAMTSTDFAGVDSAALRRAQEKLQQFGGKPADVLEKPKLAVMKNG